MHAPTERYPLDEIHSGQTDDVLWVTLGFSSPLEPNDVLHIVASLDSGETALYLERFDQAYCCYGGAQEIRVTQSSVLVVLNDAGRSKLDFTGDLELDVAPATDGYADAVTVFRRMSETSSGRNVRSPTAW